MTDRPDHVVLGVDTAWSTTQPSGFALVSCRGSRWRVDAVAPSARAFHALARGEAVDWSARPTGGEEGAVELSASARLLAGRTPDVVTQDMPLARSPFRTRRVADDRIASRFGRAKCATHSPTPERPGPRANHVRVAWESQGLPLETERRDEPRERALLEVYPHVALLELLGLDERLKYKVARSGKLFPGVDVKGRIAAILKNFRRIADALEAEFGPLPFELPKARDVRTLTALKPYEDALEALVCAWMGVRYVEGEAEPVGDEFASIWVPSSLHARYAA